MTLTEYNAQYIVEESAEIYLHVDIIGEVVMTGSVNNKKGKGGIKFKKMSDSLKTRFFNAIKKKDPSIEDVEDYVKTSRSPLKFKMVDGKFEMASIPKRVSV